MAFDASAVYAGRGMILYRAPFSDTTAPPALTIAYGTDWASPWIDCGYTQDGAIWTISHDYADINVDQELSPVLTVPSGQTVTAATNLAEYKVDNVVFAVGQGDTDLTAATALLRGVNTYELTGEITDTFYSFGMDYRKNSNGEALRAFLWKSRPQGQPAMTFGIADSNPQIAVELRAYPDTSTSPARIMTIQDVLPVT